MRIEKINDNQIRCTLTKQELADRQIKLSELAYGSEKARGLFRDMIEQANYEFGFEAEDIPLMIEAIPLAGENIVLQITKVEYPDELDTRFSKFTESDEERNRESDGNLFAASQGADDVLELFRQMKKDLEEKNAPAEEKKESIEEPKAPAHLTKIFEFRTLEQVERLSNVLGDFYRGENHLYKDTVKNRYYLLVRKSNHTPEEFNKVCNIISEYAPQRKYTSATEAFFLEHGKLILKNNALAVMQSLE